ncbi:unnamed protein product [Rodentolepis nana]|uniref:Uncharacterized protein n=1 Tax=Rodentolepis nana TaxID=102285 RepID=A0A0R3U0F1_RODNA|nr:unnamed protein product [Rodentolepis nana]
MFIGLLITVCVIYSKERSRERMAEIYKYIGFGGEPEKYKPPIMETEEKPVPDNPVNPPYPSSDKTGSEDIVSNGAKMPMNALQEEISESPVEIASEAVESPVSQNLSKPTPSGNNAKSGGTKKHAPPAKKVAPTVPMSTSQRVKFLKLKLKEVMYISAIDFSQAFNLSQDPIWEQWEFGKKHALGQYMFLSIKECPDLA